MSGELSPADLAQIEARGIAREEVERQLALHASPPSPIRLERPCGIGDGIETVAAAEQETYARLAEAAAAAGRITVFVPASGAATRMFESLLSWPARESLPPAEELARRAAAGDRAAADLLRLARELDAFAFYGELRELFARRGHDLDEVRERHRHDRILAALLDAEGLGLADLPKALVPFHAADGGPRTALEEQIEEASLYARDDAGRTRIHVTVGPEFAERCRAVAARRPQGAARADITLSHQSAATDTIAATLDARPFRQADGTLLFRPGGHGALLANLASTNADLVVIKNIDNVLPASGRALVVRWKKLLLGRLLAVRAEIDRLLDELAAGVDRAAAARRFLSEVLGVSSAPDEAAALVDLLDRPLRVCGVVRNTGEPGGGPFWVRRRATLSRQIVESSQVDHGDLEQERIWTAATHFNPVDIVAALRDRHGRPYDLFRYVDREAVLIADKSHGGEPLRALEHPGLWNGSMAGWNTIFVEVPGETFAPVKTLFDLLRPEHRGS
jgi:hypothetical protein